MHYTLYTIHYTLHTIHYTLYNIHYTPNPSFSSTFPLTLHQITNLSSGGKNIPLFVLIPNILSKSSKFISGVLHRNSEGECNIFCSLALALAFAVATSLHDLAQDRKNRCQGEKPSMRLSSERFRWRIRVLNAPSARDKPFKSARFSPTVIAFSK